ncbi:phosphotyrosine protein phosphatase [Permianibacter sp. IMCC34836]|uniref:low molecular weight protein tyrosine phosphatase family protein n=1 Tax=Permianibacter fluminis TaxID=2738515 RepID=UPI0015518ADE|nr:low molecular weight protein tyrosine phosphatase family protein [Permianibacter fluminis]NQD35894.1 phosphotyrosine protein phosphatase [Permianibacter fluminis]
MKRALFICSQNRLRSPTAEQVFAGWPGVETDSAGISADAEVLLSTEQLAWATVIFVMEKAHRRKLASKYPRQLKDKQVICLDIPDDYAFMQPELVQLLERKAGPFLRTGAAAIRRGVMEQD